MAAHRQVLSAVAELIEQIISVVRVHDHSFMDLVVGLRLARHEQGVEREQHLEQGDAGDLGNLFPQCLPENSFVELLADLFDLAQRADKHVLGVVIHLHQERTGAKLVCLKMLCF